MTMIILKTEARGILIQFYASILATMISITDGMTMGWTAPMTPYFTSEKSHIKMSLEEVESMETYLLVGCLLALPATIYSVDTFGRKRSLILSCALLIMSWMVIIVAPRVGYIYAARAFQGAGINMAFVAAPMYVGEIAQTNYRGSLASMTLLMIIAGFLLVYSIVPFAPYYASPVVAMAILLTQILLFSFMPETPYYLIIKNRLIEAEESLKFFRGQSEVSDEFKDIVKTIGDERKEKKAALKALFQVSSHRKAFIIVILLTTAQPFGCHEIILMNLHEILNEAGPTYVESTVAAIIFASLALVAALASTAMVDRLGRKTLLLTSTVLTGISLTVLAIYFNLLYIGQNVSSVSWIPTVSVMTYALFYKVGLGIIPIVYTTEIFAPKVKSLGMTLSDGSYMTASILSLQLFFHLKKSFGMHVPFYTFAGWTFLISLFIHFYVPETKGRTLEEIQQILRGEKFGSGKRIELKS
ncbi:hypothetical protein JTB14_034838 [Gonioctena quinquepunctata]|nr:hypothetical protein JTB14_034838 [Gonioctena quinquepunctata]